MDFIDSINIYSFVIISDYFDHIKAIIGYYGSYSNNNWLVSTVSPF